MLQQIKVYQDIFILIILIRPKTRKFGSCQFTLHPPWLAALGDVVLDQQKLDSWTEPASLWNSSVFLQLFSFPLAKCIGWCAGKFGSTEFWTLGQNQLVFEALQLFPLSDEGVEDRWGYHKPSLPKQKSDQIAYDCHFYEIIKMPGKITQIILCCIPDLLILKNQSWLKVQKSFVSYIQGVPKKRLIELMKSNIFPQSRRFEKF